MSANLPQIEAENERLRATVAALLPLQELLAERTLELQRLRAHDKETTDLSIDQQIEIGRLRAAIREYLENDSQQNWDALAAILG
jgi:hypothetical protein